VAYALHICQVEIAPACSVQLHMRVTQHTSISYNHLTNGWCVQGDGVFFDDDGNSYEGEWMDGKRHGRGRAVYGGRAVDGFGGDVYEGHWENGMR
jgi:hypothetical protein